MLIPIQLKTLPRLTSFAVRRRTGDEVHRKITVSVRSSFVLKERCVNSKFTKNLSMKDYMVISLGAPNTFPINFIMKAVQCQGIKA